MTRLEVGVVGAGRWGRNLIRCLSALPEVRLRAVCDLVRPPRSVLGDANFESSFAALLEGDTEALVLATPAELHAPQAIAALERGKHVFVEKPMALSLREASRMRDAAQSAGRVLMVGHLLRYHPAVLQLKRWVLAGRLGRVERVVALRLGPGTVDAADNPWWSLAPHDLSLAGYLLGAELAEISARPAFLAGSPAITARARAASTTVDILVSAAHEAKVRRLVVLGTEGAARFDDGPGTPLLALHPGRLATPPAPTTPADIPGSDWLGVADYGTGWSPAPFPPLEPLAAEVTHFVSAVRGDRQVATDGEEGCRVIAALEAGAHSAAQGGAWVRITPRGPEVTPQGDRRAWRAEPELC